MSILPLENSGLKRARLIKNVRLNSVIELFKDKDSGSGQIEIEDLPAEFGWSMADPPADMVMLRKIGNLPSYDVYSLRISLREMDVTVNDVEALRLSDDMNKELTSYMTDFTRPLIMEIYGDSDVEIQDFSDVIKLFRSPDVKEALEKIRTMSAKLNIKPEEIPRFMEDYGDIFLSLSYYRRCLDAIEPVITEFLEAMDGLRDNYQFKNDQNLLRTMDMMESTINELMAAITGRFENFERGTKHMWDNISAERFRKVMGSADHPVLLTAGASYGASKLWGPERFAAVARHFQEKRGRPCVVLAGPKEVALADGIAKSSGATAATDPVLPLHLLKALVERCSLMITGDTGPRHIAVALDRPVVCIMGPSDPRYTDYCLEKTVVLRKQLDCSPCQRQVCPLGHHDCMKLVTVEEVVEAGERLLGLG